jgi:uncharacterized membrane protein YdbT with pleckstrin-like domain
VGVVVVVEPPAAGVTDVVLVGPVDVEELDEDGVVVVVGDVVVLLDVVVPVAGVVVVADVVPVAGCVSVVDVVVAAVVVVAEVVVVAGVGVMWLVPGDCGRLERRFVAPDDT